MVWFGQTSFDWAADQFYRPILSDFAYDVDEVPPTPLTPTRLFAPPAGWGVRYLAFCFAKLRPKTLRQAQLDVGPISEDPLVLISLLDTWPPLQKIRQAAPEVRRRSHRF